VIASHLHDKEKQSVTTSAPSVLPQSPASASGYYLAYLFLISIPATVCLTFFLQIAPPFKDIFADFKTALPAYTMHVMDVMFLIRSGGWVVIVLAVLGAPILPARWTARSTSRQTRFNQLFLAFNLMFLLSLIFACLAALALYLPLIKLVQSVSGQDTGGD
jgi:hypothetical protein